MFEKSPLLAFSFATAGQASYLIELGVDLCSVMSEWTDEISNINDVYYKYWLWLLGAYEIVRTMDENKACFAEGRHDDIKALKIHLAEMRIPFAKQQLRGNSNPATKELSVCVIDNDIGFEIKGRIFSAVDTIEMFKEFVLSIQLEHVIARFR
jgi:hypothetical protein